MFGRWTAFLFGRRCKVFVINVAKYRETNLWDCTWRKHKVCNTTRVCFFSSKKFDTYSQPQWTGVDTVAEEFYRAIEDVEQNELSAKCLKRLLKRIGKEDVTREYFQSNGIPLSLMVARKDCKDEQLQQNIASVLCEYKEFISTRQNSTTGYPENNGVDRLGETPNMESAITKACLPILANYLKDKYPKEVYAHRRILRVMDLSRPEDWYPLARSIKRKVILHIGPTNSGKTHAALEALRTAKSGIYCGPLRLLAWEIQQRLQNGDENGLPVPCDLLTGQEQVEVPNAHHVSCTVEMTPVHTRFQVGVIDEVYNL